MNYEQIRLFNVKNFMTNDVLTVGSDSNVRKAVEIMVNHEIGSVVVLEGARPIGIFTERDLLRIVTENKKLDHTFVKDVISPSITRITSTQGSHEAARLMIKSKGRLLVFENEKMVGIVTPTDIVKAIYRTGIIFDISSVISKKVVTTPTSTPLKFVVREMNARGVGSVILTENRVPRGIFTERDLLNKVLYLELGLNTAVIEVATFPMVTAELGIGGRDVAGVMVSRNIKRLPLMERGKIVGIVTARDLVEAYAHPAGIEDVEFTKQFRVRYGELCPMCNTRIDDRGLCACGAGGE